MGISFPITERIHGKHDYTVSVYSFNRHSLIKSQIHENTAVFIRFITQIRFLMEVVAEVRCLCRSLPVWDSCARWASSEHACML